MGMQELFGLADSVLEKYKNSNGVASLGSNPIDLNSIHIFTRSGCGITGLLDIVSVMKQIAIACVPWKNPLLKGCMMRYYAFGGRPQQAIIHYSDDLNRCWTRFVICKELAHVLLDTQQDYTVDPNELINNLINAIPDGVRADVDSETLAQFGAIELLIPNECRDAMDRTLEDRDSSMFLAERFRVPEKIVIYRTSSSYPRR